MPKRTVPLTDRQVMNAKPAPEKRITSLFDGGGLYLEIHADGVKRWRMKYRHEGKARLLTFGTYPAVSLVEARGRRDETRKLLAGGFDPVAGKQAEKATQVALEQAARDEATNTFKKVAEGWREVWKTHVSPQTETEIWANLERNIFPDLGDLHISQVTTKVLLDCLRQIEAAGRGATLRKARGAVSLIFKYAIQNERGITQNPVANFDRHTFKKFDVKNFAAILEPVEVGKLLRAIDNYRGTLPSVAAALRLAPLLFQRIGELRTMRWADLDLENGEWFYTVSKTKTPHHVPLSRQAVAILEEMRPHTEKFGEYVFPGQRLVRPISNVTINTALEAMGYNTQTEMTGHGFRAMAYTLLREKLKFPKEIVDFQLAHRHGEDRYNGAYARMTFSDERREMMQEWADYLDKLKAGAEIVQLRGAAA
ncbi:integrase [Betaproteobacteria bacterium]|nr:integrase [Betaproteobacteria bacterium]GHU46339.1 integrase [Betaproteobacteria bacterium]